MRWLAALGLGVALAISLPSCTQTGIGTGVEQIKPQTAEERLLAAGLEFDGAMQTVLDLINAGVINQGNAREVLLLVESAQVALTLWRENPLDVALEGDWIAQVALLNKLLLSLRNKIQ